MPLILLFVTSCVLGGLGGALGSILGHAFGQAGLWIGGVLGGLLSAVVSAAVARRRMWITPAQFGPTSVGAAVGFLAAAAVAVNTLSSPLGPVLSTTLVGAGALSGATLARPRTALSDHAS